MRTGSVIAIVVSFVFSGESLALSPCPDVTQRSTAVGRIFVDEGGMTLYSFRDDERYRPHCLGSCAAQWPPFDAAGLIACDEANHNWSIIVRSDGRSQWALDGRPMYRSAMYLAPGEMTSAGPAWAPAGVPCPAAKSRFGTLSEDEAYAVVGGAIAKGIEPVGELRRWCGIGIDELSIRAKISVSDIRAQESGKRDLGAAARLAISQALGAPVYLLLE